MRCGSCGHDNSQFNVHCSNCRVYLKPISSTTPTPESRPLMESVELKGPGLDLLGLAGKVAAGMIVGTMDAAGQLGGQMAKDGMGYSVDDWKQEDIVRRGVKRGRK